MKVLLLVFIFLNFHCHIDHDAKAINEGVDNDMNINNSNINIFDINKNASTPLIDSIVHDTHVYVVVEEMPIYGDCDSLETKNERKKCSDSNFISYLIKNFKHNKDESCYISKFVFRFIIEKDGSVSNMKIIKGKECSSATEYSNLLKNMKWKAGKHKGHNVRVQFTLPIHIHLAE